MASEQFNLLDPIATVAAAFAGAWLAFYLERSHKAQEEVKRRVGAANRAIYTLYNIWNIQEQYRKEIVEPYRGRPDAWLNMAATIPASYGISTFEAGELSFLLESKPDVYTSLLLEEQRFALAMQLIKTRSDVMLGQAWPRINRVGIGIGQPLLTSPGQTPEQVIGADIVQQLRVYTDSLVKNIDENLTSLVSLHNVVRAAMADLHPLARFIRVDFQSTPNAPAA
jgi:hypothetical protein